MNEGSVVFKDAQHILVIVIWSQTYGRGRKEGNVLFNDTF